MAFLQIDCVRFHDYMLQVEELLRHYSTRLLVVARMLYDEGSSSKHVPLWRVDQDVGEIMNKIEYLVMSVVDTVDNLCHLALDTDPDFAALVQSTSLDGRASWLTIVQQDRRNWRLLLQCRAGKNSRKPLGQNLVRYTFGLKLLNAGCSRCGSELCSESRNHAGAGSRL